MFSKMFKIISEASSSLSPEGKTDVYKHTRGKFLPD